jgi:hypothetical protein
MRQTYYEQNYVSYYAGLYDFQLDFLYRNTCHYYVPRNGRYAVGIGGSNAAMLHLRVNLVKRAKLSFWYANTNNPDSVSPAAFFINGTEARRWTAEVDWSFAEFDLAPGENNLIWEKNNAVITAGRDRDLCFLSLDDIFIYYPN